MKKLLALLITTVLMFSMVSCGGRKNEDNSGSVTDRVSDRLTENVTDKSTDRNDDTTRRDTTDMTDTSRKEDTSRSDATSDNNTSRNDESSGLMNDVETAVGDVESSIDRMLP